MVSTTLVFEVAVAVGLVVGVVTMRPAVVMVVGAVVLVALLAAYLLPRHHPAVGLAEQGDEQGAKQGAKQGGEQGGEQGGATEETKNSKKKDPQCAGTGVRVPLYSQRTFDRVVANTDTAHTDRIRPTPGTRAPPLQQREAFIRAHRESIGSRDSIFYVRADRDTQACAEEEDTTERYYGSALEGEHAVAPFS